MKQLPRLLPVLLLLAAHPAAAQLQSGNVYVTVTDDRGAALPGATVTLSGLGAPQVQVTGAQGQARFLGLAPGNYGLRASLEGFSTVEYPTVNVGVGRNTELAVQLAAAVEDVITVTSESPLLDERKITAGSSVSRTELEKVPTSRDPWAVLGTVPGVRTDRINVGGNESGQQAMFVGPGSGADQAVWAVDGVVITDMGAIGSSPTYYNFDAFEEMQVSTGGSDTSLATGGVTLNMVTKRGTNQWRGSGRFITADESWQSDTELDEDDLADAGPWNGNHPQPAFKQGNRIVSVDDWGVEAGGPIVRDRLWIWGNYGTQEIDLLTIADVSDFTELDTYGAKLNAQITSSNSAVAFYNYGDKIKNGRNAGPLRPAPTTWNQTGPTDVYKLEDTQIIGSNLYLTGLLSHVGGGFELTPQGGLEGPSIFLDAGSGVWANNFIHHETDRPQDQAHLDGSYFFETGELSHELKFGAGYRQVDLDSISLWPGNGIHILVPLPQLGLPDFHLFQASAPRVSSATTEYASAFVQDTLSAGRLTANVGLRYDLQQGEINSVRQPALPGFESVGLVATSTPARDQGFEWEDVTPRLGLTYALGEQRQTLLRASYSRFADQLGQGFTLFESPVSYRYVYFYNYYGSVDFDGDGVVEPGEALPLPRADNGFDPLQQRTRDVVDPAFEAPLTDEVLLGLEHALRPELVLGLSVTWRNLHGLAESERLVTCQPGEHGCFRNEYGELTRLHRRSDYEEVAPLATVRPDGSTHTQRIFRLKPGIEDLGGDSLTNGDREQDYLGASVTFNKRLANRWMLRGNVTWSEWEWDVPEAELEDPNVLLVGGYDGDEVLQGSGSGSGSKGNVFISSNWSYDLTGVYQIAPERPWGFNVSGHLYGREGYPIPYFRRVSCGVTRFAECSPGNSVAIAASAPGEFRNPDVHLLDLRLEKDFTFGEWSLTLLGEVFNVTNEATPLQTQSRLYQAGTTAGVPFRVAAGDYLVEVISPRVFRVGTRFSFR